MMGKSGFSWQRYGDTREQNNISTKKILDDSFPFKKRVSKKVEERELLTQGESYKLYQEYP